MMKCPTWHTLGQNANRRADCGSHRGSGSIWLTAGGGCKVARQCPAPTQPCPPHSPSPLPLRAAPAVLQIERANIPRPREGRAHSDFGFVNFKERVGALKAVEGAERPTIEGAELKVCECWGMVG